MNSKVVNMQPYYSNYSRLLDFFFFFPFSVLSLFLYVAFFSLLSHFISQTSLSSSHSPSPPTLTVLVVANMVDGEYFSDLSLSLSLFDLVGIAMFVGV